ncbi:MULTISPECIES: ABC transporter permease [unclassified Mesobacillus]|uniref:ABC transporter permease n=1 Tax=unclassified Mesobacillus TaxID=2675270 RepID=UPI002040139C|nr:MULTISPECIES: ABC transporter permease [unclassified Mesobacillus]MCM3124148.1 ABC transporter permease [Mesobacillus sp. MER 33]MCM3233997.1 ABC transporter permease [Mesobacillus sp. MER 48]
MKSMFTVIKEQISSFYLIRRLSLFELKSANNNNYLGMLWEVINPMIQLSIYWFVFGLGIRGGQDVNGIPFVYWLISGMAVWFFINQSLLEGSKSIYTRINFISKMSFPMSVIPTYVIVSKFYSHLILVGIITFGLQFTGFTISPYFIQLPYFMFGTLMLLVAISLITSTLATIVRDVQMIVTSVVRMLLYLTPLLWEPTGFIRKIMMFNPLYYVVEGYRASLLGTSWYMFENPNLALYFWGLILILLMIGSALHVKFRNHFVDYM